MHVPENQNYAELYHQLFGGVVVKKTAKAAAAKLFSLCSKVFISTRMQTLDFCASGDDDDIA